MSDELKRCELEETESYHVMRLVGGRARSSTIHVLECSECGRTCEHVNGAYKRCPHCGAINVLDENYEPKAIPGNELEMIRMAEKYKKASDCGVKMIRMPEKYQLADDDGAARSGDGADSQEQLEADVIKMCHMHTLQAGPFLYLLDRQAAITERECLASITQALQGRYKALNRVAELKAELEAQRKRANDAERGVLDERWYVSRDRYEDDIAELTAERNEFADELKLDAIALDELRKQVDELTVERDEWKTKCETCEVAYKQADAERKRYSEQIDELFAERDELKTERDEAVEAYDAHMSAHDSWHEAEDITYTRNRFTIYEQATKERIARLESERDALQAKLDALKAHGVTVSEPFCGGYEVYNQFACDWRERVEALEAERDQLQEQHGRQANTIERLTAERDRLRRFVDGGAYDCMTCEAKAELAERADSLEAELKRKQHVIDVQRDSFLKLEVENAALRKAGKGNEDA